MIESTQQVLASGYGVGLIAGLVAWFIRRALNDN